MLAFDILNVCHVMLKKAKKRPSAERNLSYELELNLGQEPSKFRMIKHGIYTSATSKTRQFSLDALQNVQEPKALISTNHLWKNQD